MTIRKKKYLILIITALLVCCAVIFFVRQEQAYKKDQADKKEQAVKNQQAGKIFLKAVPFQTAYGWGYNIMADNKIFIHQDYIPYVSGKQGFKTREDALLVGNRVIQKISKDELPTINQKDLNDLGIFKK
jgi:hypothetical protein